MVRVGYNELNLFEVIDPNLIMHLAFEVKVFEVSQTILQVLTVDATKIIQFYFFPFFSLNVTRYFIGKFNQHFMSAFAQIFLRQKKFEPKV
jgi:hypothetical protein